MVRFLINYIYNKKGQMKKIKKKDTHPLAINVLKFQRYNFDFFNCEEVVFFEYIVVKGMAFKKKKEFFHSSETIRFETGIKKHSLNTIIKRFQNLGIISIEVKGMPKVKHFTVHFPKIVELLPQIYQLTENGQLQAVFSKHLADFFAPLVENYLQKNNIKNNKKENIKEKIVNDSDEETSLSIFNEFLSSLKFKNKISPAALKFNEVDFFKALNQYDLELLFNYMEKYFKESYNPSLKQFFKFDKLAPNKIIKLEEMIIEEEQFIDSIIENLNETYNQRIAMYNEDDNYSRAKSRSKLAVTNHLKSKIKEALNVLTEVEINNAFKPYIDEVIRGETNANKILPYFFAAKDGEYEVINNYLDYFNINYGYDKQ